MNYQMSSFKYKIILDKNKQSKQEFKPKGKNFYYPGRVGFGSNGAYRIRIRPICKPISLPSAPTQPNSPEKFSLSVSLISNRVEEGGAEQCRGWGMGMWAPPRMR